MSLTMRQGKNSQQFGMNSLFGTYISGLGDLESKSLYRHANVEMRTGVSSLSDLQNAC